MGAALVTWCNTEHRHSAIMGRRRCCWNGVSVFTRPQAGYAPAQERTSDAQLATRRRGLAQPRKKDHRRTARFRERGLKKTDIFVLKYGTCAASMLKDLTRRL